MNDQMKEYLCHMTDAEKKAYNAEYYRNHKNYWQDYYSKGRTVGRPVGRQKYVTEGNGQGVYRRGAGLNDYYEIFNPNKRKPVGTGKGPGYSSPSYATDEEMGWQDGFLSNAPANDPRKKLQHEYYEFRKYANMNDRLVKEYTNKANDCKRLAKEYEKQREGWKTQGNNLSAGDAPYRKWNKKIQETLERAEEYERKAKDAEKTKQEQIDGMKRCLEGIKRQNAEIEAHNSHQYEHGVANKPHGASVNSEAFSNAYKKERKKQQIKQKVQSTAKQAVSDWKAGAKGISSMAKDSVESGKKALSKLLSKFR